MNSARGFTLIEVLTVVAIIGILSAVAIPSYRDYVLRGRLMDGVNGLTSLRADMERYYQDNRTYEATGSFTPPCQQPATGVVFGTFTISCSAAPTATTYTLMATGSGATAGFAFSINQAGVQATPNSITGWNSNNCSTGWILRRGQSC